MMRCEKKMQKKSRTARDFFIYGAYGASGLQILHSAKFHPLRFYVKLIDFILAC